MRVASFVPIEAARVVRIASAEIGETVDDALVYRPADLATEIVRVINGLTDLDAVEVLARSALDDLDAVMRTTANRIIQHDNQVALIELIRGVAATRLAALLVSQNLESQVDAERLRDVVNDVLDNRKAAADTDTFRTIQDLQTAANDFIRDSVQNLPDVVFVTPSEVTSSLRLAWQLHGSIAQADAIASRNHLPRPGFVPGRPVEIVR